MIDYRYRVIFIHPRKIAGTSIKSAFGLRGRDGDVTRYDDGVLGRDWPERDPSYFVFSCVRNPFDRLISSWQYLKYYRRLPLIEVLTNPPGPELGHDYRHMIRPQSALLKDPATGRLVVDDLIRFENLRSDFDRICDRIGKPRTRLKHRNWSWRLPWYRYYFDVETRRLAEEMYADDVETFGYRF